MMRLLRDTVLLISPAVVGYLFIIFFVKHPDSLNYELFTLLSLFIGGILVGYLFRKERGDSSIRSCLNSGSKLYITFFLHSLYLTLIITFITLLLNLLINNGFSVINSAPFLMFVKITSIAIVEKFVCIYAPMIIGNWLYGWKKSENQTAA